MEYELINLNDYTRTVFDLGIPTPEPYRLVTDGELLAL